MPHTRLIAADDTGVMFSITSLRDAVKKRIEPTGYIWQAAFDVNLIGP